MTLENRIPVADGDVGGKYLHVMTLCIFDELRRRIKTERHAVEHRNKKRLGLMALQPAARIHKRREARRMTLREAVLAEAMNLLEDGFGEILLVASLHHSVDNAVVVFVDSVRLLS